MANAVGCDRAPVPAAPAPAPFPDCAVPAGYDPKCERDRDNAGHKRINAAKAVRTEAAKFQHDENRNPRPRHPCNGDEDRYKANCFYASFSKGLPHNNFGEPDPGALKLLFDALDSGDPSDFEQIPLGRASTNDSRPLENPQAALAFELLGGDSHQLYLWKNSGGLGDPNGDPEPCGCDGTHPVAFPPAPEFRSAVEIGEMAELYWMALARDVPFLNYDIDPLIQAATVDLAKFGDFGQPQPITRGSVFRGFTGDDLQGPYVSQFLLLHVPYGSQVISAQIRTLASQDFLTNPADWLDAQNGRDFPQPNLDVQPRYIRNGRDLGQFVHVDRDFTAFINAAKLLLSSRRPLRGEAIGGLGIDFADGLPYNSADVPRFDPGRNPVGPFGGGSKSQNQSGVATFGDRHVLELLLEVMNRGLRAAWYQKWSVHRRLRPEEFGGCIHHRLENGRAYEFDAASFASLHGPGSVLERVSTRFGSYLLPMEYAEGCPIFPAYPQGHATVAGAAVTLLKAFFKDGPYRGTELSPMPVVAAADGLSLVPAPGNPPLTVHQELNKLASNIPLARNFAGVHWRSDYSEGLRLGEQVTVRVLQDIACTFREPHAFKFRSFDGYMIDIQHQAGDCPKLVFTKPNPTCP